jgi:hypothetical protein
MVLDPSGWILDTVRRRTFVHNMSILAYQQEWGNEVMDLERGLYIYPDIDVSIRMGSGLITRWARQSKRPSESSLIVGFGHE